MKGSKIKERLFLTGTTQTELARLLGITPQAVSGILAASDVRTGTVERICSVLNLPLSFFYDDRNGVTGNLGRLGGGNGAIKQQMADYEKDREIQYLRGQVAAYENALSLLSNDYNLLLTNKNKL